VMRGLCRAQGELEISHEGSSTRVVGGVQQDSSNGNNKVGSVTHVPFMMLALDLPPAPLYRDALERNIIPQVKH
jgi:U4/U6.U5 tri-snRNP-associated protein 2